MSKFTELGLGQSLLSTLTSLGYETPTPIQEKAIPVAIEGKDILASADTGTGKTAAFVLPCLEKLQGPALTKESKGPRVLILTPTRELANQVTDAAQKYGAGMRQIRTTSIVGGAPYEPQRRALRNFVDILVATPGRLLDHYREGKLCFKRLEVLILDEADRMLDMGFADEVEAITDALPKERQTLMFSATLGRNVISLANSLTKNPVRIEIKRDTASHKQIDQGIFRTKDINHKIDTVKTLLMAKENDKVIIFAATKQSVDDLHSLLNDNDIKAFKLHGDMQQSRRESTIYRFKRYNDAVLVATDVAARGIDVQGVSHVINFDIPRTAEDYTHRIGRTGRAGASGKAITFISASETGKFKGIERELGYPVADAVIEGADQAVFERRSFDRDSRGGPRRGGGDRSSRFGGGRSGGGFSRPVSSSVRGPRRDNEQSFGDRPQRSFSDRAPERTNDNSAAPRTDRAGFNRDENTRSSFLDNDHNLGNSTSYTPKPRTDRPSRGPSRNAGGGDRGGNRSFGGRSEGGFRRQSSSRY